MNVEFKVANYNDVEGIIKLCDECFDEHTNLDYARKIFEENKDDKNLCNRCFKW